MKDPSQEGKDDLPHWAKEGLKNPNPEFGFDVYNKDNLPQWAQKGMTTSRVALLNYCHQKGILLQYYVTLNILSVLVLLIRTFFKTRSN